MQVNSRKQISILGRPEAGHVPTVGFANRGVRSGLLMAYTLHMAKAWFPYFQ
jgi:hypothetical protein